MTTEQTAQQQPEEQPMPAYTIDPHAIEAHGRMISTMIESRLCDGGRAKLKSPDALQTMKFVQIRRLLRQHCSNDPAFLNPQMPVMEAAFRFLLMSSEDSVPLELLHGQIAQLWMDSPWPRHISIESLARVLAHDQYYGVVPVVLTGQT
jgi:hypothetical protein